VFEGSREIVVETRSRPPTRVPFPAPSATDDRDPEVAVTCDPPAVEAGATEKVLCTATDDAGNPAQATFIVTVLVVR
jgi:hypothetical protein